MPALAHFAFATFPLCVARNGLETASAWTITAAALGNLSFLPQLRDEAQQCSQVPMANNETVPV